MTFQPGDHVVYPAYGAGTILALEDRVFVGTTTSYYILKMVADEGQFLVPVDQAESLGVRSVVKSGAIQGVLASTPEELPSDYKERQAGIEALLSTSDAKQMSLGARDMAWFSGKSSLTGRDIQLYEELQTQLASELSLSESVDLELARVQINDILTSISEKAEREKIEQEAQEALLEEE
jgi:CarD family transcriptional regulator